MASYQHLECLGFGIFEVLCFQIRDGESLTHKGILSIPSSS